MNKTYQIGMLSEQKFVVEHIMPNLSGELQRIEKLKLREVQPR